MSEKEVPLFWNFASWLADLLDMFHHPLHGYMCLLQKASIEQIKGCSKNKTEKCNKGEY
jgi:hypothetical protein